MAQKKPVDFTKALSIPPIGDKIKINKDNSNYTVPSGSSNTKTNKTVNNISANSEYRYLIVQLQALEAKVKELEKRMDSLTNK